MVSLGTPRRIVMLGDRVARGLPAGMAAALHGNGYDRMWPFGTISSEGATDGPDLIIHLGDYIVARRTTSCFLRVPPAIRATSG